jgi:predicted O-methyltransferase YrrM
MNADDKSISKTLSNQEGWPPGHYYSSVPDFAWIARSQQAIFKDCTSIPGIDLNLDGQIGCLQELATLSQEFDWPREKNSSHRFYDTSFFSGGSPFFLFAMMKIHQPQAIIEVGSGFSSAVMLDTLEYDTSLKTKLTFIEPYPERLHKLLRVEDRERCTLIERPVQEVPVETFLSLQAGDFLFIDSSHVAKTGSDVNYLYLDILPRLNPGVIVHIHDIYWPFEYPKSWILDKRWAWNEAYFLRALLQNNNKIEILIFVNYLARHHGKYFAGLPFSLGEAGSSIWLRTRLMVRNETQNTIQ